MFVHLLEIDAYLGETRHSHETSQDKFLKAIHE